MIASNISLSILPMAIKAWVRLRAPEKYAYSLSLFIAVIIADLQDVPIVKNQSSKYYCVQ